MKFKYFDQDLIDTMDLLNVINNFIVAINTLAENLKKSDLSTSRTLSRIALRLSAYSESTENSEIKQAIDKAWAQIQDLKLDSALKEIDAGLIEIISTPTPKPMASTTDNQPPNKVVAFNDHTSFKVTNVETVGRQIEQGYSLDEIQACMKSWETIAQSLKDKKPVFFGRSGGQRVHRLAFHALIDAQKKGINLTATQIHKAIAQRAVEKALWPDVANYWLTELASFRTKQLNSVVNITPQDPMVIMSDREIVWPSISAQGAKSDLWDTFAISQAQLGKDWQKDVNRDSYRPKPIADFWQTQSNSKNHRIAKIDLDLINRRACKYLLHLCCFNFQPIVYSLDDMSLPAIAHAAALEIEDTDRTKSKVPVCTSEIRELFRSWDSFKDNVLFVNKLNTAPAPWDNKECAHIWARYALHLARKILIANNFDHNFMQAVQNMLHASHANNPQDVIKAYHDSKPSAYRPLVLPASKAKIKQYLQAKKNNETFVAQQDTRNQAEKLIDALSVEIGRYNRNIYALR